MRKQIVKELKSLQCQRAWHLLNKAELMEYLANTLKKT